jgi:hypothetical protein
MAPAGLHGVMNDAIAIFLNDATLAIAFVARWCAGYKVESADGVFQIREDAPTPRSTQGCTRHREAILARSISALAAHMPEIHRGHQAAPTSGAYQGDRERPPVLI